MTLMSAGAMPAAQLVAPTIDVAGQFQQGKQDAAQNTANDMANQAAQLEVLATGAAYALPQGPNGPVDPAKWNEVLDTYEASGMPADKVKAFRDNPNMASVLLKGSSRALKASNDAALFDLEKQKLEADIALAMSGAQKNLAGPTPTDDQRELAQVNAERKAKGQPPLGMEEFLAGRGGNGITITNPDGTTTQIGGKGNNAYDQAEGKGLYQLSTDIATAGRNGTASKATLGKMRDLLNNDQVYTGIGADAVAALQRAGKVLGIDSGIQDTETFNSLSKQAALDLMGGSLGSGFSNADRSFVEQQVPNLGNTKQGNMALIGVLEKIAQRKVDIAKFATDYKQAHGGKLDWQFDGALADWAEANPLFSDADVAPSAEASATGGASPDTVEETQTIDGVKYVKRNGKWFTAD